MERLQGESEGIRFLNDGCFCQSGCERMLMSWEEKWSMEDSDSCEAKRGEEEEEKDLIKEKRREID